MAVDNTGKLLDRGGRAGAPHAWVHKVTSPDINLAWHHSIPVAELRVIWNNLLDGGHFRVATNYLDLVGVTNPNAVMTAIRRARSKENRVDLPASMRDELDEKLTWPAWNIVEGPGEGFRDKADDPASSGDLFKITGNAAERSCIVATELIYRSAAAAVGLDPYKDNTTVIRAGGRRPSKADADKLNSVIGQRGPDLRNRGPMPFNEDMWVSTRGRAEMGTRLNARGQEERYPIRWLKPPIFRKAN